VPGSVVGFTELPNLNVTKQGKPVHG